MSSFYLSLVEECIGGGTVCQICSILLSMINFIRLLFLIILPSALFAQNYLQYEVGTTSRQCGYPGYSFDWSKIQETADKYPNPHILIVTGEERRKVEEEIKLWNEEGNKPRRGMDPCSNCSQEYDACVVFDYLDANLENCSNWTEWRDNWDRKVHDLIDKGLSKFTFADPNIYTLNFRLAVGPDGKVMTAGRPVTHSQGPNPNSHTPPWTQQDMNDFARYAPVTLSNMTQWFQAELLKIRACPFPKGSRLRYVERTPSVFHNVPGEDKKKPSPVPKEPGVR